MTKVYFASIRDRQGSPVKELTRLLSAGNLEKTVRDGDIVAVKSHFGEEGNVRYIRPVYIRKVVEKIKELGGRPFLTDTTTLYLGGRFDAIGCLQTAAGNGFTKESVGAPMIVGDGLLGNLGEEVSVGGEFLAQVSVASVLSEADKMIVVSHFKCHEFAAFGGAIKNLGMGCVTKRSKGDCHKANRPIHIEEKCSQCEICIEECPYDCISLRNKRIFHDRTKCMGCLRCYFKCPDEAMELPDNITEELQGRIAESAKGVTQLVGNDRIVYVNMLIDITPLCDCVPASGTPIVPDIGFLMSSDPVAIDKASIDLVDQCFVSREVDLDSGVASDSWDKDICSPQVEYAEKIGLGKSGYKLVEV